MSRDTPKHKLEGAIIHGDYQAALELLESGAVKASGSCEGWTFATLAASFNQVAILRDLLLPRLQPKQLLASFRGMDTGPAHQAALNNKFEVLKLLADHGVDMNEQRADGCTPLDLALGGGNKNSESVKLLKEWIKATKGEAGLKAVAKRKIIPRGKQSQQKKKNEAGKKAVVKKTAKKKTTTQRVFKKVPKKEKSGVAQKKKTIVRKKN